MNTYLISKTFKTGRKFKSRKVPVFSRTYHLSEWLYYQVDSVDYENQRIDFSLDDDRHVLSLHFLDAMNMVELGHMIPIRDEQ